MSALPPSASFPNLLHTPSSPPSLNRQLTSSRQVQRSAHYSLLGRISVVIPLLAVALGLFFSSFRFTEQRAPVLLLLVAVSLLLLVPVFSFFWFRKAIAPRRRGGRGVRGRDEADDDTVEDEEVDEAEERKTSEPSTASPVLAARSVSLPSELERHDAHERVSDFWHPPSHSPSTSSASAAGSTAAAASPSPALPAPLSYLASTKYISSLSQADFAALYAQIGWRSVAIDAVLYEVDEVPTDGCFILVSGRVSMHRSSSPSSPAVCFHGTGELLGDEAVFPTTRWMTCRAVEATQLIVMSAALLEQWKRDRPEMIVSFVKTSLARQWRIAQFCLHSFLRIAHTDAGVGRYHVEGLEDALEEAEEWLQEVEEEQHTPLLEGQTLFQEGSHTHQSRLFIVRRGVVVATRPDHPDDALTLSAGAVLDPLAFIADTPHHYTITAQCDADLVFLTPAQFTPTLAHPALYSLVMGVVDHMRPSLQRFTELGLKLEWRKAGEFLFVQRQRADDLYLVVSGRVRVLHETKKKKRKAVPYPSTSPPSSSAPASPPREPHPDQPDAEDAVHLGSGRYGKWGKGRPGGQQVRLELGRGDCCGETSFLGHVEGDDVRHTASAVCVRDSEVVRVSRRSYEALVQRYPAVLGVFTRIVSLRLEQVMQQSAAGKDSPLPAHVSALSNKAKCVCVALIPLSAASAASPSPSSASASSPPSTPGSPSSSVSPFSLFCRTLSRSLDLHGLTLHIRPSLVDSILGPSTCAQLDNYYHRSKFTAWLTEQEEKYDFLCFEADSSLSPWSSLVVRTADYALLVADAGGDCAVSAFEWKLMWEVEERKQREEQRRRRALRRSAGPSSAFTGEEDEDERKRSERKVPFSFCLKDLVLLHPAATALPSGTRSWFKPRPHLHTYHHVRVDLASHYDRLARYLANKSIGVVLGGGGARGLAHQGVLNAAVELRVPVDVIGGTSQGSMMAGLFAQLAELSPAGLQLMGDRAHDMAKQVGSVAVLLSDATFPMMSYFSGRVFSDQIRAILGADVHIEDLWIKYFCVSVNMSRADLVVHTSGRLWQACRASMSILEYLPPMQLSPQQTDILIDGGYINNCFAEDTRLLTNQGFLFLQEVRERWGSLLFASYDPATRQIVYTRPVGQLLERPAGRQRMINFTQIEEQRRWAATAEVYGRSDPEEEEKDEKDARSNHVSLWVTRDHDMYVQRGRLGTAGDGITWARHAVNGKQGLRPYEKVRASELLSTDERECARFLAAAPEGVRPLVPSSSRLPFEEALRLRGATQRDAFLELYGFWLGDGSLTHRIRDSGYNAVQFAQRKKTDRAWLEDRFVAVGLTAQQLRGFTNKKQRVQFYWVIEPRWFEYFDRVYGEKYENSRYYRPRTVSHSSPSRLSTASPASSSSRSTRSSSRRSCSSSSRSEIDLTGMSDDEEVKMDESGHVVPPPSASLSSPQLNTHFVALSDEDDEVEEDEEEEEQHTKSAKWFMDWVLTQLDRPQLRLLCEGFRRADGSWKNNGKELYTSSVRMRDELIVALLHAGYTAFFTLKHTKHDIRGYTLLNSKDGTIYSCKFVHSLTPTQQGAYKAIKATADAWRICYGEGDGSPAGNMAAAPSLHCARDISAVDVYTHRTWCVTVPSGLLIAQRAAVNARNVVTKASRPLIVGNCPVDVLRELYNPVHVIAVDVENKVDDRLQQLSYYGDSLSGWWLLWQKLSAALPSSWLMGRRAAVKIPKYSDLISALLFIQHNRNIRQFMQGGVMDVYVRPQLGDTQLLDYHKEKDIVERGYRMGRVKLTEWRLVQGDAVPYAVLDGEHLPGGEGPGGVDAGGGLQVPKPEPMSRSQTIAGRTVASQGGGVEEGKGGTLRSEDADERRRFSEGGRKQRMSLVRTTSTHTGKQ